MDSGIIQSVITACVTLIVCLITNANQNSKTKAMMEFELGALRREVEKHNNIIERVFQLERRTDVQEEQIKVANKRIADLENH